MSDPNKNEPTATEIVTEALNEQGYLFQHKIIDSVRSPAVGTQHGHDWQIVATEVPVSLPNGEETRIDLILRPRQGSVLRQWRIVMECKRSAREYKRWVFFGAASSSRDPASNQYYIERADLCGMWDHKGEVPWAHRVEPCRALTECPIFDFGVEAKLNRRGNDKKSSSTTAIEDACQQVMLGQAGLVLRLKAAPELYFRVFPVVVTTAELVSAQFSNDHVCLERGMIQSKDLALETLPWLSVNFRMSDVTGGFSGMPVNRSADLAEDLASRHVRTVFITQAVHLQHFLSWLQKAFQ